MAIAGSIVPTMPDAVPIRVVEFEIAGPGVNPVGVVLVLAGLAGLLCGLYRVRTARRAVVARTTGGSSGTADARDVRRPAGFPADLPGRRPDDREV
ncbi:hypothetical protein [Thermostaphylospora chromogena]|uniref:Uncharacterized protein n=1 Tax=Thermostaphylospora chromogena TaxID=35622 RepID=A0A1H1A476_9ACTN|nr:hypothetical protein [Thermostaphylospora chromogena]SDQ34429.1 hypothetical protein SAMN04489764_0308 [Thermostaphylospora chromogena]